MDSWQPLALARLSLGVQAFILLSVVRQKKKPNSPYYTGNDRFLWPGAHDRPAALLPTPVMPEQMHNYLNLAKGKTGAITCHYKVAHEV